MWSVSLALLADTFEESIGRAMGWSSIAMSLGLLVSPAIGGAVFNRVGYYAVFYVAFGCIALDIFLRLILIEKKVARQWLENSSGTDVEKGVLDAQAKDDNSGATSHEILAHTTAPEPDSQQTTPTTSPLPAAIPPRSTGLFAKYPKLRLFKSRRTLAANLGVIIQAGVMFSFDTVLPLFVKTTFHWSSTAAGLIFFCLFIPGFVSPAVGALSDRYGARWPSFAGFLVSIPLLICMRFVTDNTTPHKVLLGALLALMGVTLTFSNTPLMAEITYAIEAEEARRPGVFGAKGVYGLGYGLFCTSFALGGSAGTLMSGYVMAGKGWGTLTWVLAVWMAGGAVVVGLFVGENTGKRKVGEVGDGQVLSSRADGKTTGSLHEAA